MKARTTTGEAQPEEAHPDSQDYTCSFCGKLQSQVARLIAGPLGVYICNVCVDLMLEIIQDSGISRKEPPDPRFPGQCVQVLAAIHNALASASSFPDLSPEVNGHLVAAAMVVTRRLHEHYLRLVPPDVLQAYVRLGDQLDQHAAEHTNSIALDEHGLEVGEG